MKNQWWKENMVDEENGHKMMNNIVLQCATFTLFFFSFSIEHKIILRSSNDSRHSHILALVSLVAERENETEVVVAINPHALLLLVKLLPESEI